MDSATGLLYVGNGQYYDPATGRFLTRDAQPNKINPYVPRGDPIGSLFAPLVLVGLIYGRKKKKSKFDYFVIMLFVVVGVGMGLSACAPAPTPVPPTNTQSPDMPPTGTATNTSTPTNTPDPNQCNGGYGCTAYLTFDDGPDPKGRSVEIAVVLGSQGIKATFFINGLNDDGTLKIDYLCTVPGGGSVNYSDQRFSNVNPNDYQLKVISDSGHVIGLHGDAHLGFSVYQAQYNLDQEVKKLDSLGINYRKIIRAPYGDWGRQGDIPVPGYEGWRYYHWTINSCDNDSGNPSPCNYPAAGSAGQVVTNVMNQLENKRLPDRPIILLHSTNVHTWNSIVNPTNQVNLNQPYGDNLIVALRAKGYTNFRSLPRENPEDPVNTIIQ